MSAYVPPAANIGIRTGMGVKDSLKLSQLDAACVHTYMLGYSSVIVIVVR